MEELFIDGHKLPRPLKKEEVYDLLIKMQAGDSKARETLVQHNIRLVLYEVTGKFKLVDYDKKDLVSIGIIGLMKAINTFDVSKKYEFATYATRCIDNEILMFLRKIKKDQSVDSLDRPINQDKDRNELRIEDTLSDGTDIVEDYIDNESYQIVRRLVEQLPDRDRKIIMMHFGFYNDNRYTQKEIAAELQISQSYISRIITKIVKKLKIQLESEGLIEEKVGVVKRQSKKEGMVNMSRKLQSIYEYFGLYSKEEINIMLTKLSEEERKLITLRYGDDLENPVQSPEWTKENNTTFYGNLVPKMKRMLANPNNERKPRERKADIESSRKATASVNQVASPVINATAQLEASNTVVLDTEKSREISIHSKIYELFRNPMFMSLLSNFSHKEAMIASLKLGYINGKLFTTDEVANFLGIDSQEVIDITRTVLLTYKKQIDLMMEETIKNISNETLIIPEEETLGKK